MGPLSSETFHTLSAAQAAGLPKATTREGQHLVLGMGGPPAPGVSSQGVQGTVHPCSDTCWCYSPSLRGTALTYSLLRHTRLLLGTEIPKV